MYPLGDVDHSSDLVDPDDSDSDDAVGVDADVDDAVVAVDGGVVDVRDSVGFEWLLVSFSSFPMIGFEVVDLSVVAVELVIEFVVDDIELDERIDDDVIEIEFVAKVEIGIG